MNDYVVSSADKKTDISVTSENTAVINGVKYTYELVPINPPNYFLKLNNRVFQVTAEKKKAGVYNITLNNQNFELIVRSALQEKALKHIEMASAGSKHTFAIKAPMPGMILKIKKNTGDSIKAGESIIILEAMKMENDVHAPGGGTIKSIDVKEGSAVEKGAILFTIE